jgi:hypothetical protein
MADKKEKAQTLLIEAPRFERVEFTIEGTAPYMQLRFSQKAMATMATKMMDGSAAKKGKKRDARDFDDDYRQAMHAASEGWIGIPAPAFRVAAVSACRIVGFKMTLAKLSLFFEADGLDEVDGTPLIRILGEPEKSVMPVRNANGAADLRVRPVWRKWSAKVRCRYDRDQFTELDVTNLMLRVGSQVGIGEGRPDSRKSCGLGYGLFDVTSARLLRDGEEVAA